MQLNPIQQINFNNGKTFYIPVNPQIAPQIPLYQSHAKSQLCVQSIQPLSFRSTSSSLSQNYHPQPILYSKIDLIPSISTQVGQARFYNSMENSQNLKTGKQRSYSISWKQSSRQISQNKRKILESKKQQGSGIKLINNQLNSKYTKIYFSNKMNVEDMPTKETSLSQEPIQQIKMNVPFNKIESQVNSVTVQRKIYTPKTTPLPIRSFSISRSSSKIKDQKQKQHNIKTNRSSKDKKTKQIGSNKKSVNYFCEKSTGKAQIQIQSNDVSIGNVEQNSFSRYFDNLEAFPSLVNRVSYQNIEIQKKNDDSHEEDMPNLFMDFDKVASPIPNKNQSIPSFVHFDSTLLQSKKQEPLIKVQKKIEKQSVSKLLPFSLIVITLILLIIQTIS